MRDLDNDGDAELVFTDNRQPAAVLRNDSTNDDQWLQIGLVGRCSNRDAIGAILELQTSEKRYLSMIKGGGSYLSQCDYRCLWGIPKNAEIKNLTIRWPRGKARSSQPAAQSNAMD